MKILITGDAGFVGRAFHRYLDGKRHDIVGVDIANGDDARDFFRKDDTKFDLVIHLAAVVGGRTMIESSPLALAVDLSIDAEMFSWALRTKPKRIVYFSSSAAYPVALQASRDSSRLKESDIDLNNIATPDMVYGWAKLTGEMLAGHARTQGQIVHVFRPFSGYGSDQSSDYPFPSFIARARRRDDLFEIWGDGTQMRDFIHVDDIVEAVFAGIDAEIQTVNLCSGNPVSFNELARLTVNAVGYQPKFLHVESAPVGVACRVGDPTLMNTFYIPRISLEEGIDMAANPR